MATTTTFATAQRWQIRPQGNKERRQNGKVDTLDREKYDNADKNNRDDDNIGENDVNERCWWHVQRLDVDNYDHNNGTDTTENDDETANLTHMTTRTTMKTPYTTCLLYTSDAADE